MPISAANLKTLRVNPDWASLPLFDRRGWTKVRFGEVVENLNETVRDPGAAGIERFIGLEHLEPGSLHVRQWGSVADGTTFTRRCRPGQVLFGKRRAYQRKVAVAEFDAVVSGDIYVLAPADSRLLPELLPFLCLSERFFQHAVGTSAGSLSPRTNWSSLASFEFDLPPLDQQRRIAGVLSALDDVLQQRLATDDSIGRLLESTARHHFDELAPRSTPLGALIRDGDVDLQTGPFGTVLAASSYTTAGVPVVNPINMDGDSFDTSKGPFIQRNEADRLSRYQMHPGDIVMCRKRHVGRMVEVLDEHDGYIVGSDCIRIRSNPTRLLSRFLLLYLRSGAVQRWLVRATIGTVMPGMNEVILSKLNIPVPEREIQEHVVASLSGILRARMAVRSEIHGLGQVRQALQNHVFAHRYSR